MKTLDSRSRNFGVLVLRHEGFDTQPGYDESNVIGMLAKNVIGRQTPMAGGRFIDKKGSVGNVSGGFLWPKNTRKAPLHFFNCAPAIIAGDDAQPTVPSKAPKVTQSGGVVQSGGTVRPGAQLAGNPAAKMPQPQLDAKRGSTTALPADDINAMLPVKSVDMQPDDALAPVGYSTPMDAHGRGPLWPIFPKGFYGIAMPATDMTRQINYFFPTDPRILAINNGNEPEMGTIVCDTDDDDEIDPLRYARMQSLVRVIKSPYNSNANSLALQLSRAQNHDCIGGMVIDHDRGDVIAMLSMIYGGFIDVGDPADKYHLGKDGDGNSMNPAKLSLQSIFQHRFSRDMNGPLLHEGYWGGAQDFPFSAFTKFEWDPAANAHRWRTKVPIYTPNTDTPSKTPPPTKTPPKEPPNEPTPGGGNNPPGGGGVPPGAPGGCDVGGPPPDPPGPNPAGQPPNVPSGPAGSGGEGGGDPTAGDGPNPGPGVPWDPDGDGTPYGPDYPPGYDPKKDGPPGPGAGKPPGGGGGGNPPPKGQGDPPGKMPVGPLGGDDGAGFGGWDPNPFGGPFGWKPGGNGSKEKQEARAKRKAAKAAKKKQKQKDKDDKNKKKKKGWHWVDPPDPGDLKIPGVNQPEPFRHGPGDRFKGLPQFRMIPPPVPNALSPDFHPEVPKGGGGGNPTPTPVTSVPTPGVTITPPALGPRPSGGLPGIQCPPAMVNEIMLPSIIARPQHYSLSAPDLRYDNNPNIVDVVQHDRSTPVTGHMQAYGAQGGAVGGNPGLTTAGRWIYTVRPRAGTRWWQGSGNGGWWITTPETDLADMNSRLNPQNITQSKTYFGAAPRVYFGVGLPDLNQGGMYTGYRWGADRSGNATFDRMDGSGIATPILDLGADGLVTVLPRGGSAGQGGEIVLASPDGTSTIAFQAPDSTTSNLVLVMPDADPGVGDALSVASIAGDVVTMEWAAGGGSETSSCPYIATADGTCGNTGVETTLIGSGVGSLSIAANSAAAGRTYIIDLQGYYSTKAAPVGNITLNFKLGTTTICTTGAVPALQGNKNQAYWRARCVVTFRTIGSTGTVYAQGTADFDNGAGAYIHLPMKTTGTTTIDTTTGQTIDFTATWATSNIANTLTATDVTVQSKLAA